MNPLAQTAMTAAEDMRRLSPSFDPSPSLRTSKWSPRYP